MAGTSHVEEGRKGGPPPDPPLSMTQSLSDSGGLTLLGVGVRQCALHQEGDHSVATCAPPHLPGLSGRVALRESQSAADVGPQPMRVALVSVLAPPLSARAKGMTS